MNNDTKNRWQVRVAAVIIFVLGFTAGILALNVYRGVVRGGGGPGNRFDNMAERLNLTADQKTKVQEIFSDTREQLRAVRQETEPRMAGDSPPGRWSFADSSDSRTVAAVSKDSRRARAAARSWPRITRIRDGSRL